MRRMTSFNVATRLKLIIQFQLLLNLIVRYEATFHCNLKHLGQVLTCMISRAHHRLHIDRASAGHGAVVDRVLVQRVLRDE